MIGFTSGAFAASVAQANYSAAKGGIVSLVRSAAAGHEQVRRHRQLHRAGREERACRARCRSASRWASPKTSRRWSCFLLSDHARDVTGQIYTVNGGRIAVWNQPAEVREMRKDGRWTVDEIAARFDEVGQEPMPILERLAAMEAAAKAKDKPNS